MPADESAERAAFEAHLKAELKTNWLYNNPHGHELVDLMVKVIPAEINGHEQNRAGEYVTEWVETMWRGWLARAASSASDTHRLEWVAQAWGGQRDDFARHVLMRGGTGDLSDIRTFIDRASSTDARGVSPSDSPSEKT